MKNLSAKCKICRRAGRKLFLKGERCYSSKCALVKKKYPPGVHGVKGYPRQLSEYGQLLREKQSMKFFYGLSETQFKNYFGKAKLKKGDRGVLFLKFLEERLDNILYRAGFFVSRKRIRQIVNHGHILVNDKRVTIPSYQLKVGDLIKLGKKESIIKEVKQELSKSAEEVLPVWMSVDKKKIEVKILKEPDEKDLPKEFDVHLIVEFYSR